MKYYKHLAWMMAIAIASTTLTACSSDDNETEKPFTTDPVESSMLYACGVGKSETRSVVDAQNVLFTENDIEWFNVTTREIKFKDMDEPRNQIQGHGRTALQAYAALPRNRVSFG